MIEIIHCWDFLKGLRLSKKLLMTLVPQELGQSSFVR